MANYYHDWRNPDFNPNDQRTAPCNNPSYGDARADDRVEIPKPTILPSPSIDQLLIEQRKTNDLLKSLIDYAQNIANNQVMFAGR